MRVIVSGDHSSLKFEFTFVLPDLERFILLENELFAPDVRNATVGYGAYGVHEHSCQYD